MGEKCVMDGLCSWKRSGYNISDFNMGSCFAALKSTALLFSFILEKRFLSIRVNIFDTCKFNSKIFYCFLSKKCIS